MTPLRTRSILLAAWAISPIVCGLILFLYRAIVPGGLWFGRAHYWTLPDPSGDFSMVRPDQFRSSFSDVTACGQFDQGIGSITAIHGNDRREIPALWVEVSSGPVADFRAIRSDYFGMDTAALGELWYFSATDEGVNRPLFGVEARSCPQLKLRLLPDNPEYLRQSFVRTFEVRPK